MEAVLVFQGVLELVGGEVIVKGTTKNHLSLVFSINSGVATTTTFFCISLITLLSFFISLLFF